MTFLRGIESKLVDITLDELDTAPPEVLSGKELSESLHFFLVGRGAIARLVRQR